MPSPFDGTLVWIWNFANCDGGNYDAIAARIAGAGARGVIVKAADGPNWFPQGPGGRTTIAEIVRELRARGLVVCTWSYCYGANLASEAQRAIETVQQAAPDAHVLDVEQEFEDQPNTAQLAAALAQTIAAAIPQGFPLAYSPLPAIAFHLRLPYRQFTDAGLAMLPQLYWTGLRWTPQYTVKQFYDNAATYQLAGNPIFPAYEDAPGSQPTDEDLDVFLQATGAAGATGISVWSYEHLDGAGWQRVARAARAFPASGVAGPCPELRQQLVALRLELMAANVRLAAVRQALA